MSLGGACTHSLSVFTILLYHDWSRHLFICLISKALKLQSLSQAARCLSIPKSSPAWLLVILPFHCDLFYSCLSSPTAISSTIISQLAHDDHFLTYLPELTPQIHAIHATHRLKSICCHHSASEIKATFSTWTSKALVI